MATPFQGLGIFEHFGFIFPFLLIFVIVWGVLSSIKLFGDNKSVNATIALILAFLTLFSPIVRNTINTMAPWFILFFFFLVFVLIAFKIFGFSDGDIMSTMVSKEFRYVNLWIIAVMLIIGLGSLMYNIANTGGLGTNDGTGDTTVVSDGGTNVASANQEESFWSTLVHPKVLGFILIILISLFTIQRLTVIG